MGEPARKTGSAAWKHDAVRVVAGDRLDLDTAQTPGMERKAAIKFARVSASKLRAGTVRIHPNARTGAHHHGPVESLIDLLKGRARVRWGEALQFVAEAGPGDSIGVPPFVPHHEINASAELTLEFGRRSGPLLRLPRWRRTRPAAAKVSVYLHP